MTIRRKVINRKTGAAEPENGGVGAARAGAMPSPQPGKTIATPPALSAIAVGQLPATCGQQRADSRGRHGTNWLKFNNIASFLIRWAKARDWPILAMGRFVVDETARHWFA
jgi:hypothetical protein